MYLPAGPRLRGAEDEAWRPRVCRAGLPAVCSAVLPEAWPAVPLSRCGTAPLFRCQGLLNRGGVEAQHLGGRSDVSLSTQSGVRHREHIIPPPHMNLDLG